MDLRRVLFEYRLSQKTVAAAARAAGYRLYNTYISSTASGNYDAPPLVRESIRAGLKACGVPDDVIASIPEIAHRAHHSHGERTRPVI